MDDQCLDIVDSVASVLSECMQYSGNEDLSDMDMILLSLRSSSSHVGNLLDEILVTRQRQMQDDDVANLMQLRICLSELCLQYETKLLFRLSQNPTHSRVVVPYSVSGRPRRIINFALVRHCCWVLCILHYTTYVLLYTYTYTYVHALYTILAIPLYKQSLSPGQPSAAWYWLSASCTVGDSAVGLVLI